MRPLRLLKAKAVAIAATAATAITIPMAAPALAAPAAPSAPAHPAAAAGSGGASASHPASHPTAKVCSAAVRPGFANCLSLRRTDVKARKGLFAATADGRTPRSAAAAAASAAAQAPAGYGPVELQNAYNLASSSAQGASATVAIVDAFDDPTAEADLQVYRAQYGLPVCDTASGCFSKVAQNGSTNYPPVD